MGEMRTCKSCQNDFVIEERDDAFYQKIGVPRPQTCPRCRERARLAFRNERFYYQRSCDLCSKPIISVYDPKRTKAVYCHSCWWSDKWDPTSYGRDFDFSKPFFPQYHVLLQAVPKLAMQNDNGTGSENCEYTYDFAFGKNAYLVVGSWHAHDSMYGFQINYVKDCIDNYRVNDSQLLYESILCERCYGCQECMQCHGCSDCIFGFDLKDCKDCLLSAGLRHKQYYIFNKPYSKEEYFQKKLGMRLDSWEARERLHKEFEKFLLATVRRCMNLVNCEDCTGDHLLNSKNSYECYEHRNLHTCKWMTAGDGAKDCYECYSTGGPELCYQSITPDNSYNCAFTVYCWKSQNVWYSENCHSSHNLFGSIGMKRRSFCVLNKQYSKEEYIAMRGRIVNHMTETHEYSEFFPSWLTLFAYNESVAHDTQPLEKNSAAALGYAWQDVLPGTLGKQTIDLGNVPDSIKNIDPQICKEIFPCTACGKNFKILESEFSFYKKQNIPLPRKCVNCRHFARKKKINPLKLWARTCMKCQAPIQTTYAPERPEIVYCEKCYLETVY
ncbi:hypothetical protein HYW83_03550 [Candidatus Peregrinibacteria bacterium]|nr:hypothetical protein [Candidatus Peregrinibacteria bacterium]